MLVEMTPYDYKNSKLENSNLDLPEGWNCRIETCPEKFANNEENIFGLGRKDQSSIKIRVRDRVMSKLNANSNLFGIVDGHELKLYNYNKGFVKSIRVLAGDK